MAGDLLPGFPRMTMAQFNAFRRERPEKEKWELIASVPVMMPPPRLMHQRISATPERLVETSPQRLRPECPALHDEGCYCQTMTHTTQNQT